MSKIRFFEVAGRKVPLIPPEGGRRSSTKKAQRIGYGTFPSFGGGRGGLILVLTIALAGASLGVNAQDTQKFKIIKTDYAEVDEVGGSFHRIGELNGAVLNADTLSVFGPLWNIVNISNETFPAAVRYDIIGIVFLYAEDASLLLKDTLGNSPRSISMKDFLPNDTVIFGMFLNFPTLINYLKEERGIDLEQISHWEMISGIRYTSKNGYYSDSVFYAGADTVSFRVVRGGVGIVETHCNASLRVYPNPTKNQLTIDCRDVIDHVSTVEIYSVVGQRVYTTSLRGTECRSNPEINDENTGLLHYVRNDESVVRLDISHLAKGMYYLKINNQVTKFVKE